MWKTFGVMPYYEGNYEILAGLFVAFATLYPNVEYWGSITLKWIAFACVFISSLGHLPRHDWRGLLILWGLCLIGFGYVRFLKSGDEWPQAIRSLFRRKPKFRVVRAEPSGQEASRIHRPVARQNRKERPLQPHRPRESPAPARPNPSSKNPSSLAALNPGPRRNHPILGNYDDSIPNKEIRPVKILRLPLRAHNHIVADPRVLVDDRPVYYAVLPDAELGVAGLFAGGRSRRRNRRPS